MSKYSDEQRAEALAIAVAAGPAEASRQLGIPAGTIRSWVHRERTATGSPVATERRVATKQQQRRTSKMIAMEEEIQQAAIASATERITETLTDRLTRMADELYGLAEKAIHKVDRSMDEEAHDRDGAAWLRSLVGVLAQAVDKAQLLAGKPTARPEVTERHEYHITQEIISQRPELLDEIFAKNQRPSVEDRSG